MSWLVISWWFKKWKVIHASKTVVFSAMILQCQGLQQQNLSPQCQLSQPTGFIIQDEIIFSSA